MTGSYADDVSAREAHAAMKAARDGILLDVRTLAEWNFVGLPDLRGLNVRLETVEWQRFPGGDINADFIADVQRVAGEPSDRPIWCLCRSGARSAAAASALMAAGYSRVFNIGDGFEGPLDDAAHRGRLGGWKASGLPWRQG